MEASRSPLSDEDIRRLICRIDDDSSRELSLQLPELDHINLLGSQAPQEDAGIEWIEDPVTFHEFVNDPYHMKQPPLGPRQRQDIETFLGPNPKCIFSRFTGDVHNNNYRLAALLWGKGSGKDWVCTLIQCYLVYLLLCMRDPHKTVGLAPNEAIDIVNVAYSAHQANEVYFTKFLQRVLHWEWLRRNYPIVQRGRVINKELHANTKLEPDGQNYVRVGTSKISFPHLVRAVSEHSENESYEGLNILFWVMDEAAAFRSAGKKANAASVFGTLRTSAMSRFPSLWRGMVISYPRSEDDFMITTYKQALADPEWFASKACTWEANPTKVQSDFDSDFEKFPTESRAKYMCEPPPRFGAAFDPEAVDECVDPDRTSLIVTSPAILTQTVKEPVTGRTYTKQFVGKALESIGIHNLRQRGLPRVFHVDGGLTGCPAGFVLAHAEPVIIGDEVVNKVIVDVALQWKPIPAKRLQVSLNNIAALILDLSKHMHIVLGTYDQWNSESSLEALFLAGIPVEKHNIASEDYSMLEMLVNLGCVSIPGDEYSEWQQLTSELKNLVRYSVGDRIRYDVPKDEDTGTERDGSPKYTKDVADCLAGVARLLNLSEIRSQVSGTQAPSIQAGTSVLRGRGSPITVEKAAVPSGQYLPPKIPRHAFPTEAGFMGRSMTQTNELFKQHALLKNVGGDPRLVGVNKPSSVKPPKIILKK
jgi:hypothetical protein